MPTIRTAKLFLNGRSQAVRLPASLRFEGDTVFIRQEGDTGDVVLSRRPHSTWRSFLDLRDRKAVPENFMADRNDTAPQKRKLF